MDDPVRSKIGNFGKWQVLKNKKHRRFSFILQAKIIMMMSCVGLIYNWQLLSTPFINPAQVGSSSWSIQGYIPVFLYSRTSGAALLSWVWR